MTSQQQINYERITQAIGYIREHFKTQPNLDEVAQHVHLSPYHFQRLFTEWAGVSPKQFLQYISVEYAKSILKDKQATLFEAAFETGLSGTGRLHDLFVKIEGMTPGEYRNGGESLLINYSFAETMFGDVLVASTKLGICYLAFSENAALAFTELKGAFPRADFRQLADNIQQKALQIFSGADVEDDVLKLHLKGTAFQIKVWETLLKIPSGNLISYGDLARQINNPYASRAVGSAIGANPVAFLIPCHRVIQSSGITGGYHWGSVRKTAIIGWEAAHRRLTAPV